jgi:hypothetical protein
MKHDHSGFVVVIQIGTFVACIACLGIVSAIFISNRNSTPNDTTGLSAACVAVTAVVSVMPWQLAPLLAERTTERFRTLVACGIHMCLGSLCFIAATILKYGFIRYSSSTEKADIGSDVCYYSSVGFFIVAVVATGWGFHTFITELAHECFCKKHAENEPPPKIES